MGTCWTGGWGRRAFVNVPAIQTPPFNGPVSLEHPTILQTFEQATKASLVLPLGHGNHVEDHCDGLETFLPGLGGEVGIESGPFLVLASGRRRKIFDGGADDACREATLDLHFAALKGLEEPLGVFLLLTGLSSKICAI